MKSFLDGQYVHLLQLLKAIITEQPNVSIPTLAEKFSMAPGTTNGLIKQLREDLKPYALDIHKNESGLITLTESGRTTLVKTAYSNTVYQQLMMRYLNKSKIFFHAAHFAQRRRR
ncbi:helix-turn-helix domain-containing protein [Secundilactobacillus kimchicus]|uniref:helix-turn-helix domain-containing protein n=1 Tax=Secundilactobacillus kimchicus TaxID=528209 RepID=UPI0006E44F34|nr:helix-turn-helix domain-containing protein [Secundilactobacillus kimchicus]